MQRESTCIKIPKVSGEKTVALLDKFGLFNKELEIHRDEASIYIPLIRKPSEKELKTFKKQVPSIQISTCSFTERKKRTTSFIKLLEDKLAPHLLASLPRAADFVGDIAVIEIPPELDAYRTFIGEAILQAYKTVRTVVAKAGAVSGTYRVREYAFVAGEPKTETVHKEHGCRYHVDLARAYFSPRLSYEHKRVASLVSEGETILDMFAGVGPFAVLIAKKQENVKVYAVDLNQDAVEFLKKNVRLNRVENRVHPILGDARQIIEEKLSRVADRVVMNLPEKALEFVDVACKALKPDGGIVHFYCFVTASESLENMQSRFIEKVERYGRKVEKITSSRLVRETAPYEWQAVIDAKIR